MSDLLTIKTNNIPRDVLRWYDLTDKERTEFDYIDTEDKQADASFFRYKRHVYDLGEFMRCESPMTPQMRDAGFSSWDGYAGDSYFSGVVVRYVDDCERVIVGTYYA